MKVYVAFPAINLLTDPCKRDIKVFSSQIDAENFADMRADGVSWHVFEKEVEGYEHIGVCGESWHSFDREIEERNIPKIYMDGSYCNIPIEARHSMPKGKGRIMFIQNGKEVEEFKGNKND